VSDVSQGPGWWQASDGNWYPPELHADYDAPLPPPPKLPPPPASDAIAQQPADSTLAATPTSQQPPKPAKTRQVIQRDKLGVLTKIGQGGQGVVYRAPNVKTKFAASMVYKEYKPQARADIDFTALAAMPTLVEESLTYTQAERLISIAAWPCAIIEDTGTPTGFVMPAIPDEFFIPLTTAKGVSPSTAEFQHLLNHSSVLAARGITLDDAQRYALLRETASALAFFHKHGVCVGDISPKNLLFSLTPHEAVYFIDCDAMRINTVSALRQVETPGWEAPAGEELATIYSDAYKLGLLAVRLLAGDHDTANPQHLPSTTPDLLRQVITDTLTNPPQRRPLPEAWNYVLGNAIEHAQHRQKSAAPAPVSTAPASTPQPLIRSRPSTPTPQSTPPAPPPTPVIRSRSSTPTPQSTPPTRAPASPVSERPPINDEFPAISEQLPPAAPSAQAHKRPTTTALLIGAIVVLAAALALTVGIPALTKHQPSAAPVSPPSTTSTTPTTPPPVAQSALGGLLLSPDQIDATAGTTGFTVNDYPPPASMWNESPNLPDKACVPLWGPAETLAYAGSGSGAVHGQSLDGGTQDVQQYVLLFSSAHDADTFFTASAQSWPACSNRQYTHTYGAGSVWTVGPVYNTNGTLTATESRSSDGLTCQRALTVANNVAIDVDACNTNQAGPAVTIAQQIAAKVPTT
jgi:serine/threonine protein kinase